MCFKLDSRKIALLSQTGNQAIAVGLKDYSAKTKKAIIWYKKEGLKRAGKVPDNKLNKEYKALRIKYAGIGVWIPGHLSAWKHQFTPDLKDILAPDGKACLSAEQLCTWMAGDKKSVEFLRKHSDCRALKTYLGQMGIACLTADGIELLRCDRCWDETTDSVVHCPPNTPHFGGRALASGDVVVSIRLRDDGFSTGPPRQPPRRRHGTDFDDIDSVPGESTAGAAFAQYSSSGESGEEDGFDDSALGGHMRESNNHYAKLFEQYLASKDKDGKEEMDFTKDFLKERDDFAKGFLAKRSEKRRNEAGFVSNFLNEQPMNEMEAVRTKSVAFTSPRGKSRGNH